MPRKERQHEVGDFHHVMAHGIDSLQLFASDEDCRTFSSILNKYLRFFDCQCYCFVFMKNHYHLILRPGGDNFSALMRCINSAYARYINKTRKRRGYVFWDRFKSIPTRDMKYLKNLVKYIHANPYRAGLVNSIADLGNYRWSSHWFLLQKFQLCPWLNLDFMKSIISEGESYSSLSYLTQMYNYCCEDFDPWVFDNERRSKDPLMLAKIHSKEASWIRSRMKEADDKRVLHLRAKKHPTILQDLLSRSLKTFDVRDTADQLLTKKKNVCNAIKLFSYWAIRQAGFSGPIVAKIVQRSSSAVLRSASLGEALAEQFAFPISI